MSDETMIGILITLCVATILIANRRGPTSRQIRSGDDE